MRALSWHSQDLDEMEFERGIWGAALNGDLSKVQRLLRTSRNNAHARDSSGMVVLVISDLR